MYPSEIGETMANEGKCAEATVITERSIGDKLVELGGRAMDFVEAHPAVPVIAAALCVFGSMGRSAIKVGWTPEQVTGLGKSFPVQITIPALSI